MSIDYIRRLIPETREASIDWPKAGRVVTFRYPLHQTVIREGIPFDQQVRCWFAFYWTLAGNKLHALLSEVMWRRSVGWKMFQQPA